MLISSHSHTQRQSRIKFIYFILFFFCQFFLIAQEKKKVFTGKIVNDSVSVENVHIINKNSRRVAISNALGEFEIPVKLHDTLVFSSVLFAPYQRIVVPQDFQKLQVLIRLIPQTNELAEVKLERNNLAIELGLPNAEKIPKTKLEARLDGHTKASIPLVILGTLIGGAGGIDNLYYVLSGQRKKDRKLSALLTQDKIQQRNANTVEKIKQHFKKDFFIYTLKIPVTEIDAFLEFCEDQQIISLFNQDKKLEVTEILIQQSEVYLAQSKD